ncbi:MAG TPA: hypothetical protein PLK80_00860 [bacterium]|mgnify:CR=1 FL=1|nr:hypothetical protein [bacterium]HPI75257.1 hypothetical protein [bacterium]
MARFIIVRNGHIIGKVNGSEDKVSAYIKKKHKNKATYYKLAYVENDQNDNRMPFVN